ncbi:hypothetical protein FKM82_002569 [Ascaphus truei]
MVFCGVLFRQTGDDEVFSRGLHRECEGHKTQRFSSHKRMFPFLRGNVHFIDSVSHTFSRNSYNLFTAITTTSQHNVNLCNPAISAAFLLKLENQGPYLRSRLLPWDPFLHWRTPYRPFQTMRCRVSSRGRKLLSKYGTYPTPNQNSKYCVIHATGCFAF